MFNALSPTYKGILLGLLGYSAFCGSDLGVKILTKTYPIAEVIVMENALACGILLAFSPWLGGVRGAFARDNLKINLLRGGLNFFVSLLVVYSFRQLPMADAYTMFFTIPIIAALWAIVLYKEKAPRNRVIAILLGFAGVLAATRPGGNGFDMDMLAPLTAAVLISLMFLCVRSLPRPSLFAYAFVPLAGALILTLPIAVMDFKIPALADIPVFAASACCAAIGFIAVSLAFRVAAAAAAAPTMYVQLLWGLVFGYFIFADKPDLWMLLGAGVIIVSGIYLVKSERKRG